MSVRKFITIFKQAINSWSNDKIALWSAALAYYTVFSLSPLLLVIIGITGFLFGADIIEAGIFTQLRDLLGNAGASLLQTMVENTTQKSTSFFATIIGLITLLLGATGVFGQLQEAFNHIWKVEPKPGVGLLKTFRNRILSFSMVLIIAFLLLVSLVLSSLITVISTFFEQLLPVSGIVLEGLNFCFSFGMVTILFMLLFKNLPDVQLSWKDVFAGSVFTAVLFVVGKTLLGVYLGGEGFASTYGAASSLIVLLVWVYYTAQIVFLGAEFTKEYIQYYQQDIIPNKYAMVKEPAKGKSNKQKENVIDAAVQGYLKEREKQKRKKKQ